MPTISTQTRKQIARCLKSGKLGKDVAVQFGVSKVTVKKIKDEYGISRKLKGKSKTSGYDLIDYMKAVELFKDKKSDEEVRTALNISVFLVAKMRAVYGAYLKQSDAPR